MNLFKTAAEARATRYRVEPAGGVIGGWNTRYFGFDGATRVVPDDIDALFPVAFLVETDTSGEIPPHFHRADQFQVIVGGAGRLGKMPVSGITAHYAGTYTPYGPIVAEGNSVIFFTLRNGWDPGARYMPKSRAKLKPVARKYALGQPQLPIASELLASLPTVNSAPLIEPEANGLMASIIRVPPGAAFSGPDPALSRGQFWILVGGAMTHQGKQAGPLSCAFLSPEEPQFGMTASAAGAELLFLQFPRHDA
jgi:hypothetical protein